MRWECLGCGKRFDLVGPGSVVYCSDACMVSALTDEQRDPSPVSNGPGSTFGGER